MARARGAGSAAGLAFSVSGASVVGGVEWEWAWVGQGGSRTHTASWGVLEPEARGSRLGRRAGGTRANGNVGGAGCGAGGAGRAAP